MKQLLLDVFGKDLERYESTAAFIFFLTKNIRLKKFLNRMFFVLIEHNWR